MKRKKLIYRNVTSTIQKQKNNKKKIHSILIYDCFCLQRVPISNLYMYINKYYRYCFVKTCVCATRVVLNQNRKMTSFWTEPSCEYFFPPSSVILTILDFDTPNSTLNLWVNPYINHFEKKKKTPNKHKLKIASREDAFSVFILWRSFSVKKNYWNFTRRKMKCIQWNKRNKKNESLENLLKILTNTHNKSCVKMMSFWDGRKGRKKKQQTVFRQQQQQKNRKAKNESKTRRKSKQMHDKDGK